MRTHLRIKTLDEQYPHRQAGSASERSAIQRFAQAYQSLGWSVELRAFDWNRSSESNIALHFGLASLATLALFWGRAGFAFWLHLLVVLSYSADSLRRAWILRSLLPGVKSYNLWASREISDRLGQRPDSAQGARAHADAGLDAAKMPEGAARWGELPADGAAARAVEAPISEGSSRARALRVVLISHVDAPYAGAPLRSFVPKMLWRHLPLGAQGYVQRPVLIALACVALLVIADLALWLTDDHAGVATALLAIPPAWIFVVMAGRVLRDVLLSGTKDNLAASALSFQLAQRLMDLPAEVSLSSAIAGARHAGAGGSHRLAHLQRSRWAPEDTLVIAVDALGKGRLHSFEEAEIWPVRPTAALRTLCETLDLPLSEALRRAKAASESAQDGQMGPSDGLSALWRGPKRTQADEAQTSAEREAEGVAEAEGAAGAEAEGVAEAEGAAGAVGEGLAEAEGTAGVGAEGLAEAEGAAGVEAEGVAEVEGAAGTVGEGLAVREGEGRGAEAVEESSTIGHGSAERGAGEESAPAWLRAEQRCAPILPVEHRRASNALPFMRLGYPALAVGHVVVEGETYTAKQRTESLEQIELLVRRMVAFSLFKQTL